MTGLHIPYSNLSEDAFYGLIEMFVLREGTDYGFKELSFKFKVEQVAAQVKSEKAFIVYDRKTKTCNIVSMDQYRNVI